MRNSIHRLGRGLATILSAGALLQTDGCLSNSDELFGGLIASVLNTVIANFVFGGFGLGA